MSEALYRFSVEHVARLTGLSPRQLRYWHDTGFFAPAVTEGGPHAPYGRIYSFRDVVGLRTIAVLRKQYKVPLQELRVVGPALARVQEAPWSSLRFLVCGRTIAFVDPQSGRVLSTRPFGQGAIPVDLQPIANDVRAAAAKLTQREPAQVGRIVRHRYVVHNEPVVAGTRIPTAAIWNLKSAGLSDQAIIREYPRLTLADVRAALRFEKKRQHKRVG